MKIHKFIGNFPLNADIIKITDEETVHQIKNVLKLRPSEQIILCDGHRHDSLAVIMNIEKKFVEVGIQERSENGAETIIPIVLYCSILKRENFELVVQKATEVGIAKVIPLITSRTIKTDVKLERLQKIAKEAAELSGRGAIPTIQEPTKFSTAVESISDDSLNILFDADARDLSSALAKSNTTSIGAWIGPEGGWTDEEVDLAVESGFKLAKLGAQVLRGETAAIVASYLLCHPS